MNRNEFLAQLRRGLAGLPDSTINEIMADYEGHFAEGLAAGRSEDDVAAALGDPARLARELRVEAGIQRWEQRPSVGNVLGVVFALVGLLTFDLIFVLPILFFVGIMIVVSAAVLVSLFVAGSALLVGMPFIAGFLDSVLSSGAIALYGISFIAGAVGGTALLLLALNGLVRLMVTYGRLHYQLLDSANKSA